MNFFNSQEKPEEKPEETPTVEVPVTETSEEASTEAPAEAPAETGGESVRDALLKAVEDVTPSNPVDVCVPDGVIEDVWVRVLNDCYTRTGDFAHLGVHIKTSMCQNNGTVLTITDMSEKMPTPQALPMPERGPQEWPVGPAEPISEEDSE